MKPFQIFYITAIVALGSYVAAGPVAATTGDLQEEPTNRENEETEQTKSPTTSSPISESDGDLQTSNSQQETTYVIPEHHSSVANGHFDPSIYAGYLTPESFQQYLAQFAGAFGPYGYPGYGPAPAPVYPAPYAVQTGYDGFLVPAVSTSLAAGGTAKPASGSIITALTKSLPTIMDSSIFRVIVTALGALLVVIFGGAITTAICNLTPLCDISFRAVSYLRGQGAGNVGRMLVEEMTPERVRRASEIVKSAIRKYHEMQKMMAVERNVYE